MVPEGSEASTLGRLRALIVTNMYPTPERPALGSFVRDQVEALRRIPGLEIVLHAFAPGSPNAYAHAAAEIRRRYKREQPYDVVHAHFGLTAWPALTVPARVRALTVHGTDLHHPRTRLATRAVLPLIDLLAAASGSLAQELATTPGQRRRPTAPGDLSHRATPGAEEGTPPPTPVHARRDRVADDSLAPRGRVQVLPCGVDLDRFRPLPRAQARAELGLRSEGPYLLFPADPSRPEKCYQRARALALAVGAELLTLGAVDPLRVPLWVNAANAVLVPSEREGFGLAVLEALACDVPVLATPVGIHPSALKDVGGTLCAAFELDRWRAALEPHLRAPDPRVDGQPSAARFSAQKMAERVAAAWRAALNPPG
jgi:glycosyltransferase involved in cell wall biosynthesis